MKTYYRPVWTSGRYDSQTHSAILYNLISGYSYFFEDKAADVVGYILEAGRNGIIDVDAIQESVVIDLSSIEPFFGQLEKIGLITPYSSLGDVVMEERNHARELQAKGAVIDTHLKAWAKKEKKSDAESGYQKRVRPKVFSVIIELTYNCSEKCIHCYNPGATRNDSETNHRNDREQLTEEEYKDIIDQLYDNGLVRVCLSGGDPFANPLIWKIIEYLYAKDIIFDVFTNGQQLLGKESFLANYFPCSVGVSIYSDVDRVHDLITRVPGSLSKTLRVVDSLASLAIPLQIKCCIMRPNCKYYRGVVEIARRYHAQLQLECNIFDSVDGDTCASKYLRLTPEELRVVLRDRDIPLYVGSDRELYGAQVLEMNSSVCSAGYSGFCITPDGKLTPCVSFQSCIGDLRKDRFENIIKSPALQSWVNTRLADFEECGTHDYCAYCGLCPGLNFSKHGTPLKACENSCNLAKVRKELVEMLKKGGDPLEGKTIDQALRLLPDSSVTILNRIEGNNFYLKSMGKDGSL